MRFKDFYNKKPDTLEFIEREVSDAQKPTKEELDAQFAVADAKARQRMNWWETPSFVAAVEKQRAAAEKAAANDVQRAKRQRDAALLTDVADVFGRMYAQRGSNGAWQAPELSDRGVAANNAYMDALRRKDAVFVDFEGKTAQAKMQDYINKKKQEEADRTYQLAKDKAKKEADARAFDRAYKLQMLADNKAQRNADRQSREDIAAANRAASKRVAQIRANSYNSNGRRGYATMIDLGGGEFIEVDRNKWKTANKAAIAGVVKQAIIDKLKPEELKGLEEYGITPASLRAIGIEDVSDLTDNKLFGMWRKVPEAVEYVVQHYGVGSAPVINEVKSAMPGVNNGNNNKMPGVE